MTCSCEPQPRHAGGMPGLTSALTNTLHCAEVALRPGYTGRVVVYSSVNSLAFDYNSLSTVSITLFTRITLDCNLSNSSYGFL